jgi:hypothetical protein
MLALRAVPIDETEFHSFCDSKEITTIDSEKIDFGEVVFGVFALKEKPLAYRKGSGIQARFYQIVP